MSKLQQVITAAQSFVNPRANYAKAVISGWQLWSGADLKGKAARYGHAYLQQRRNARKALHAAGGHVVPIEHGLLVTAAQIGTDDYGCAIYETVYGVYVASGRKNLVRVA